jgi:hypothetical protein
VQDSRESNANVYLVQDSRESNADVYRHLNAPVAHDVFDSYQQVAINDEINALCSELFDSSLSIASPLLSPLSLSINTVSRSEDLAPSIYLFHVSFSTNLQGVPSLPCWTQAPTSPLSIVVPCLTVQLQHYCPCKALVTLLLAPSVPKPKFGWMILYYLSSAIHVGSKHNMPWSLTIIAPMISSWVEIFCDTLA